MIQLTWTKKIIELYNTQLYIHKTVVLSRLGKDTVIISLKKEIQLESKEALLAKTYSSFMRFQNTGTKKEFSMNDIFVFVTKFHEQKNPQEDLWQLISNMKKNLSPNIADVWLLSSQNKKTLRHVCTERNRAPPCHEIYY